jgi:hypothetical protein
MSKANLYILLLFAAFVFVCSCSSSKDDPEEPGDSSSSSDVEAVHKYKYCSYEEHEICLEGPFKACPGTGGELSDEECKFVQSAPSSSSSEVSGVDIYCVYEVFEMCLKVHGTIQTAGCPSPMEAMEQCPYGTPGPIDVIPEPVGGGNLGFVGPDYGGKYYVGSTVRIINEVLVENYIEAKCGTVPAYIQNTESKVEYVPAEMVDATGKLTGEGKILLKAVANCAGFEYPIKIDSIDVVNAPSPEFGGEIKFTKAEYAALEGGEVALADVDNSKWVTNFKEALCDSAATKIMINTGLSMPGAKVEAAAFVVCRGAYVTADIATADVVFAAPIAGGTLTFNAASYTAGTIVTADNVTNNITVTNPVQSGCNLDSRDVKIENIHDRGVIPPEITGFIPGEVKAQAYFVCNEEEKAIGASVTKPVDPILPVLTGAISISDIIKAGTSVGDIIAENISSTVDFGDKIYTACPTAEVVKQVFVKNKNNSASLLKESTYIALPEDIITTRALLTCGGSTYPKAGTGTVEALAVQPKLSGTISINGVIEANTLVSDIIKDNVTNNVVFTNPAYTVCPDSKVIVEIYEGVFPKAISDKVDFNTSLTVGANLSCGDSDVDVSGVISSGEVVVTYAHPIPDDGSITITEDIHVGDSDEKVKAKVANTFKVKNLLESGCTEATIVKITDGNTNAAGNEITVSVFATCGSDEKSLYKSATATVVYAPMEINEDEGSITITTPIFVGTTIHYTTTFKVTNPSESGCDENTTARITNGSTDAAGEITVSVFATCGGEEKPLNKFKTETVIHKLTCKDPTYEESEISATVECGSETIIKTYTCKEISTEEPEPEEINCSDLTEGSFKVYVKAECGGIQQGPEYCGDVEVEGDTGDGDTGTGDPGDGT